MSELETTSQPPETPHQAFHAIVDAGTIQQTVSLVRTLFDECHLEVDETGVHLSAIDPATVVSIDLSLASAAFESFEATDIHLGIDLDRLGDVVGMADRGQVVEFTLDPETRTLLVRIDELEYSLALIDPETIRRPPDHASGAFDLVGSVVLDAANFDRGIQAADMVADHLTFSVDEPEPVFAIEAVGDTDQTSLTLRSDEVLDYGGGDAASFFSLDYLTAINRAMPSECAIELELGTEQPAVVRYEFADGTGSVEYVLAPRISTR